jgi:hypothetical protein
MLDHLKDKLKNSEDIDFDSLSDKEKKEAAIYHVNVRQALSDIGDTGEYLISLLIPGISDRGIPIERLVEVHSWDYMTKKKFDEYKATTNDEFDFEEIPDCFPNKAGRDPSYHVRLKNFDFDSLRETMQKGVDYLLSEDLIYSKEIDGEMEYFYKHSVNADLFHKGSGEIFTNNFKDIKSRPKGEEDPWEKYKDEDGVIHLPDDAEWIEGQKGWKVYRDEVLVKDALNKYRQINDVSNPAVRTAVEHYIHVREDLDAKSDSAFALLTSFLAFPEETFTLESLTNMHFLGSILGQEIPLSNDFVKENVHILQGHNLVDCKYNKDNDKSKNEYTLARNDKVFLYVDASFMVNTWNIEHMDDPNYNIPRIGDYKIFKENVLNKSD